MGFQDSSLVMLQTSFLPIQKCGKDTQFVFQRNPRKVSSYIVKATISSLQDKNNDYGTKLVTFLGKGGSGKTTSAVLAAQVDFFGLFYVSLLLFAIVVLDYFQYFLVN